jgi:hypothetical protein
MPPSSCMEELALTFVVYQVSNITIKIKMPDGSAQTMEVTPCFPVKLNTRARARTHTHTCSLDPW